LKYFTEPSMVP